MPVYWLKLVGIALAFLPDDPSLIRVVNGVAVHSSGSLHKFLKTNDIDIIFIENKPSSRAEHLFLVADLIKFNVGAKLISQGSNAFGQMLVQKPSDYDETFLLGRSEIPPIERAAEGSFDDEIILVTGAAGSVGSALARKIITAKPKQVILLDSNEFGLTRLASKLGLGDLKDCSVVYRLASICMPNR